MPIAECLRRQLSVQLISERYADSEWHFLMNIPHISPGSFTKATGCVMSDSDFFAPQTDGPARNAECHGDVLLKNTVSFQLA